MDLGLKPDIEFYSDGNGKKVILPFNRLKNWVKLGEILTIILLIIAILGNYLFRPLEQDLSLSFWLISIIAISICMLGFYWLLFKPVRIVILSKQNSLSINKIDIFYKKTKIDIEKSKNPVIVMRGRRMIGFTIYVGKGKVYDLIIGWKEKNEEKEINLRPVIFTGVVKPSSLKRFSKKDIEEIAKHLNLKIRHDI